MSRHRAMTNGKARVAEKQYKKVAERITIPSFANGYGAVFVDDDEADAYLPEQAIKTFHTPPYYMTAKKGDKNKCADLKVELY